MPENQDEGRAKYCDGVFEATDRIDVGKIARDAADEEISATVIESVFWSDAGIRASQNSGKRILSES